MNIKEYKDEYCVRCRHGFYSLKDREHYVKSKVLGRHMYCYYPIDVFVTNHESVFKESYKNIDLQIIAFCKLNKSFSINAKYP